MPFFLVRLVRRLGRLRAWGLPLLVIGVVFLTSWPLMAWAEPAENTIVHAENYWWWFLVTASTVGYGDFFPTTLGGHLVGVYVIVGGIATLTLIFTRIATAIENARGQRMKGRTELDVSDHLVILGYTPGRTERLIEELTGDGTGSIVLGAWEDVPQHPLPEHPGVAFVRGDLTEETVLRRAGLHRTARVLVDARDDNEALTLTVAVTHVNPDAHVVVTLRDMGRARNFFYVDDDVRCVQWHSPRLATEELQDPGIAAVYAELMTHGGRNTYSAPLPSGLAGTGFGRVQEALGRGFGATVLAVQHGGALLDPGWETPLPEGSVLFYVGTSRLTAEEIAACCSA
ncbi:ion channel [Kocuria sp. CPCC 205268]|uniref:ion channel n=1 Tax=Kocuria oxytropis TaxID=3058913 RepID=UPI0034D6816E